MKLAIEPDLFERINPKVRLRWMIRRVLNQAARKAAWKPYDGAQAAFFAKPLPPAVFPGRGY